MAQTTAKAKSPSPQATTSAAAAGTSSSAAAATAATSPKSPASPKSHSSGAEVTSEVVGTEQTIQAADNLDEDDDDAGSALGSDIQSSTGSLTESIYNYRVLHGRTFNAPKTTEYWAPNDEQQNEGLDLLHNCLLMALDDKLFLAPISDNPQKVLDLGTGTGIWAIDFADMYPGAEVIGTDISPIQPVWTPPNVKFEIDDCLLEWTWPDNHFDFIHIRALYGSIPDWSELYRKAFKHIKPGGWLQDLEMDVRIQTDHVHIPDDHVFEEWGRAFFESGEKNGRTFRISHGHTMRDTMIAAGFVDVQEVKLKVPCHGWPRDPKLQQAGLLLYAMLDQSLEGFCIFLFTKLLDWSVEEVLVFVARFRNEMKKKSNCGWILTTVVYGRKPEIGES
ncbi:S-adenosyl-L-methionine-dependent methyltransferase [Rostrohypoxylon terebratum]|nr:S-adenosyl-L-methionine-dependent methyltransferase [Rostrohypoxylon terebratum]